jgi:small-conductance mechanosensitive channel
VKRRRIVAALAALCWLALAPWAGGQEEAPAEPEKPAAAAEPAAPESYPLTEVALRAEATQKELVQIEKRLEPSPIVEGIGSQIPPQSQLVHNAARKVEGLLASLVSLSTLSDIEREWLAREQYLVTWREQLTQRATALAKESARLTTLRERWQATREAAVKAAEADKAAAAAREAAAREAAAQSASEPADPAAEASGPEQPGPDSGEAPPSEAPAADEPSPTLRWIDATLEEIARVAEIAKQRQASLVDVQGQVAEIQRSIDATLEEIRRVREMHRKGLFEADAPPLWAARPARDPAAQAAAVQDGWMRDSRTMAAYFELQRERFVLHLVIILATLLAAVALRRRVAAWSETDPDLGDTAGALRRPISVTFLIGPLPALWLYPLAPNALGDLIGLLVLVPAVRLLPPLVPSTYRPIIYALAAFFFSSQLREFLDAAPFAARMVLTLENVAGIAFILWLVRPARLAKLEGKVQIAGILSLAIRAVFGVLCLALLANLLGYVAFARILAQGALLSVYAGVIAYGAYRIARGLLRVALHTGPVRSLRSVRAGSASIELWFGRGFKLLAFLFWLRVALRSFEIEEEVMAGAIAALTADLAIGDVTISLGDMVTFALTLLAAYLLSRFVRFVLEEDVFPRVVMRRGVPNAISTVVNYTILFFGFLFALAAAGFELSRITLLAGAFGVGIGFGLQNVVNNFVSGLILLFERPIQVGDTIEVQSLLGDVRRIGPRSSTVRTFDGAEVIVPNGMLISDQVTNWTLSDRRRRVIVGVGVAYGTDPERVLEILRDVAAENETVLQDPGPLTVFLGFGDSSLDFELRCWIPRYEEGFTMRSNLWVAINAKLREAGIEIPFPQRDLHLRSVDGDAARRLREG